MNIKVHFFITAVALFFFGFSITKPGMLQKLQGEERMCKLINGKLDCASSSDDYKINQAEISYSLN